MPEDGRTGVLSDTPPARDPSFRSVDACRNVLLGDKYVETPMAGPNLIALDAEKEINAGEPFLHALARG